MSAEPSNQKKSNIWHSVFGFLHKLQLKETFTRGFIFRPPETCLNLIPILFLNLLAYIFTPRWKDNENVKLKFHFQPIDDKAIYDYPFIRIKAYKLYRETKGVLYMIPLIHIRNKKLDLKNLPLLLSCI